MPKKAKASTSMKTNNKKYSAPWLKNALKSVGIASTEVLKGISPNIYEVSKTGFESTKNVVTSLRRNVNGTNRIGDTLRQNRYVQFAQKTFRNAMTDLKSGNLYNDDRFMEQQEESMFGDIEEFTDNISFGDDGAESAGTDVNVINQGTGNDAVLKLSDQMSNQAVTQTKIQKANMDAYIATNAAAMQQTAQLGAQIVTELTNINNNMTAMVQYNTDNMSRFIEASLAYYEKSGSTYDMSNESSNPNEKVQSKDVMASSSGGINISQYKTYVKQQFKDYVDHTDIGFVKSMLDSDEVLEMAASNPIGFLSKGLLGFMTPKILKNSLSIMETSFSNYIPKLLSDIGDLAKTQGNDLTAKFKRMVGKTFGISSDRTNQFEGAEINRSAIPFDGETKHAITQLITKELRDQTGYLEIIANRFKKGSKDNTTAKDDIKQNQQFWSYKANDYITKDQIDKEIATEITNAISFVFRDSDFGKSLTSMTDGIRNQDDVKEINNTLNELFVDLERSGKSLNLSEIIQIVEQGGAKGKTKKLIKDYIKRMARNDSLAFNSVNTARIRAEAEANAVKKNIMDNATAYNLNDSSFHNAKNIDELVAQIQSYGKYSKNRRDIKKDSTKQIKSYMPGEEKYQSPNDAVNDLKSMNGAPDIEGFMKKMTTGVSSVISSIMAGDTEGVLKKGASFIETHVKNFGNKINKTLFGEKNEEGYKKNGIFSEVSNGFSDVVNKFKWHITGKGYKDSKGNVIENSEDSVISNFKKIGNIVKDGVMEKLFGKTKNENGEYEKTATGILSTVVDTFKKGFDGWTDAFFGIDEDTENAEELREQKKKQVSDYLKKAVPDAITGGAIGAGVAMASSGSVLGTIVGGPMTGAALGAAVGFLSKNEKFQEIVFGKKDEEGNRLGGIVSKGVQDFMKEHKTFMVGSGVVGAAMGAIKGGGLLGTIVGGPVAGAIMGLAGGVVMKSKFFHDFVFGDGEDKKGIFQRMSDAWKRNFNGISSNSDAESTKKEGIKAIGMAATGVGAGGLLGAMVGGPVLGALAGFAMSIKANAGGFREWLFGKKDGLQLGDGRTRKKEGVIGQIFNAIDANIIKPIKTEVKFIAKDFMNTVQHKVLAPFGFLAEGIAGKIGGMVSNIINNTKNTFGSLVTNIGDTVKKLFNPITSTVGKAMSTGIDSVWKGLKTTMSMPGAIISASIKALDLKSKFDNFAPVKWMKAIMHDTRKLIFAGIKGIFKGLFKVITAPFRGLGSLLKWSGKKILGASKKIGKTIGKIKIGKQTLGERASNMKTAVSAAMKVIGNHDGTSFMDRFNKNKDEYKKRKKEILEERKNNRRHDRNASKIAKWTGNQFKEDTDEAREYLKRLNKHHLLDRLEGTSITQEKTKENEKKNGKSTAGMTAEQISRAKLQELSEEGRQTKLLYRIATAMDIAVKALQGKDISGHQNEDERDQAEQAEKDGQERLNRYREERKNKENADKESQNTERRNQSNQNLEAYNRKIKDAKKAKERDFHNTRILRKYGFDEDTEENREALKQKSKFAYWRLDDAVTNEERENMKWADRAQIDNSGLSAEEKAIRRNRDKTIENNLKGRSREDIIGELKDRNIKYDENASDAELKDLLRRFYKGEKVPQVNFLTEMRRGIKKTLKNITEDDKGTAGLIRQNREKKANRRNSNDETPQEQASRISNETGEQVQSHALGGLIKKGLSLVGEQGTELINVGDNGVEVLDADQTEEAIEEATNKNKKKRRKLSDFFKKKKKENDDNDSQITETAASIDAAFENQSDERLKARVATANFNLAAADTKEERKKAAQEAAAATIAKVEDMRSDSLNKALNNAKTSDELKKEKEEEEYKKQQLENQKETINEIKKSGNATNKFKNLFSSIFSKKGLLTLGILGGINFLKEKLPGVFDFITNTLSSIITGVGTTISELFKDAKWTEENNARTDGNTLEEQLDKNLDDLKSGNVLTDSEGNATAQTEARTKALGRMGVNFLNSGFKGTLDSKHTKRQKAVFKTLKSAGKHTVNTAKNVANFERRIADMSSLYDEGVEDAFQYGNSKAEGKIAKVYNNIKNSKVGKGFTTAKNTAKAGINKVRSGVSSVVTKGTNTLKNTTAKITGKVGDSTKALRETMAKVAENDNGVLSKIAKYIDDFFTSLGKVFKEKTGKSLADKFLRIKPSQITSALKQGGKKVLAKLGAVLTAKVTVAGVTLGVSEIVFTSLGAISGLSGTAKLFQISEDEVDGKMKLISTIIGAVTSTTIGSIIDVAFALAGDVIGTNILQAIAVGLYAALAGEDKAEKLSEAQDNWHNTYIDERDKTLEKQYETQKKAGLIGEDVTFEEFQAGIEDGTYSASYDSFNDWNAKENASIIDKGVSAIGKTAKGAGNLIKKGWQSIFGGEKSYTDKKGNVYKENSDGTYQIMSADGEDLGFVSKDSLPDDLEEHKSKNIISRGLDKIKENGGVLKTIGKVGSNILDKGKSIVKGAGNLLEKAGSGIANGAKKLVTGGANLAKKAGKALNWLVSKETTIGYLAEDGTYYKADGVHYSANGDKMETISSEELSELIKSGAVKETEITTKESGISQIYNKAKEGLFNAWNTVTSGLSKAWDGLKTGASKLGEKISKAANGALTATKNFFVSHTEKQWIDTDGSYYQSNGSTYTHYNANGDVIAENISQDDFEALCATGHLTETEIKVDSGLKKGLKSIGDKLSSGWNTFTTKAGELWDGLKEKAGNLASRVGNNIKAKATGLKNFIMSHTEKRWHSTEGGYYQSNGSTFDYYNEAGDLLAEGIGAEEFSELCASGVVSADDAEEVTVKAGFINKFKEIGSKISEGFHNTIDKAKEMWNGLKETGGKIIDGIKEKGVFGYIGGLFTSKKETVLYDTSGNYYKLNESGSYDYYNMNGDLLQEGVEASKIDDLRANNLLTEGELIQDSAAKKAIDGMKSAVKEAWDKAKDTVKDGWSKFKSWITGGSGDETGAELDSNTTNVSSKLGQLAKGAADKIENTGGSGKGLIKSKKKVFGGGFGEKDETVNGASYFSQNDSRWANDQYNTGNDEATMSNTGCGPTAMAMAVNTARGGNGVDPTQMADIAKATGNRDETGTNWNFINQSASMVGVNSQQELNPTAESINAQLETGNPVVLSGQSGGSGSDPYTQAGHYVVAVGKDDNGNIKINDPRGKSYSKDYNINEVAKNTGSSWMISDPSKGGFGKVKSLFSRKKKQYGGFGPNDQWISIIKAVKSAIAAQSPGYSQSNWINITIGGKTLKVRTDCSGFVAACLKFYGVLDDNVNLTSHILNSSSSSEMSGTGFTPGGWPGWEGLQEGDILAKSGHTEIFCRNEGTRHLVYNCGSDSSVNSAEPCGAANSSYTTIWRPGSAGTGVVTASVDTSTSNGSSSTTTVQKMNSFSDLQSLMSGFFTEFGNRALSGNFNTDYSNLLQTSSSSSSSSSDSSSASVATGGVVEANITGGDVAKNVWNYFTSAGYSKEATAGILGNMYQESGVNPSMIQGNGKGPAAGIVQWENYNTKEGRWKAMSDYAASKGKDWTDLGAQLEFVDMELKDSSMKPFWKYEPNLSKVGAEPTTYEEWKNSTDVDMATRQFEGAFERAGTPNMPRRLNAAKDFYDKFANGGSGEGITHKKKSTPNTFTIKKNNKIHGGSGNNLSKSQKLKVSQSMKTIKGGRGVETNELQITETNTSRQNNTNYINTTKDNTVEELLVNMIEILASIAGNTSETSIKLNALKNLQVVQQKGVNQSPNNIIVQQGGSNNSIPQNIKNPSVTRKESTARAIAMGGF